MKRSLFELYSYSDKTTINFLNQMDVRVKEWSCHVGGFSYGTNEAGLSNKE